MRIAIVTTYPPSSGSLNEYAFHFVRYLREKIEVKEIVLLVDELPNGQAYPHTLPATPKTAPVRLLACWRFGDLSNPLRILAALRLVQPDIVLFNLQFASFGSARVPAALGLLTPTLCRLLNIPTIVLLHNIMETVNLKSAGFRVSPLMERMIRLVGTLITRALLRADLVALTIPKYVELLEEKYRATNVLLAPHGAFDEVPPPSFDLPSGPLQIMTFGKFGTYKRIEILIEAFRILQDRNTVPIELVIAGSDNPNAAGYLAGLRLQHTDLPGLRFTGYVPEEEVPRIFQESAVVVFPYSSTTGSSGVLHQAGSFGKPVVMPMLGDLAALVEDEGYTGEFFTPGNAQSLADAIGRLLDDPAHRQAMGMQNYMAACGLPMADVVDWYILHAQTLLDQKGRVSRYNKPLST